MDVNLSCPTNYILINTLNNNYHKSYACIKREYVNDNSFISDIVEPTYMFNNNKPPLTDYELFQFIIGIILALVSFMYVFKDVEF